MGKRKCLVGGFCAFFALYNIGPNSSGNQSIVRIVETANARSRFRWFLSGRRLEFQLPFSKAYSK
jgi:hypothetical protein